ncbi:nuclear transport factor 2 family protein [Dactylosporangium sp. NPDC005572]|uniref:nuclear transport factor 2 family protein n=1 Tax=Dactylosporangium sp. NPDC005572 TaxID=3156889 RepID=UPI0033A4498F
MAGFDSRRSPREAPVTSIGVDHVRLSYDYLDAGNMDAYGSLLDDDVQVRRPDGAQSRGRVQVQRLHAEVTGPPGRHLLDQIIAEGDSIVVTGRFVRPPTPPKDRLDVEFVDVFTLSDYGLLLGYRRYYFVAPN